MKVLVIAMWICAASTAGAASVHHVPPAEAEAGTKLELVVLADAATPALAVRYRTAGGGAFATLELVRRADETWVAVLPAAIVVAPGVEYYMVAAGEPVFASPQSPHWTRVEMTTTALRRARDEVRAKGRRYGIHTAGEYVTFGDRMDGTRTIRDSYYRLDAAFSYKLWAYPLEEFRVGYTRLIGYREESDEADAGFEVSGWFELTYAPSEGVAIDGRLTVLAAQEFVVGGRVEARIGRREDTHVATGIEYMGVVGTAGFFRFGWGTVPRVPMSATIEITQLPAQNKTGVRLFYDLGARVHDAVLLGLRVGYAAREQEIGGVTGGANATVEF